MTSIKSYKVKHHEESI